jgi:hypothetical protein
MPLTFDWTFSLGAWSASYGLWIVGLRQSLHGMLNRPRPIIELSSLIKTTVTTYLCPVLQPNSQPPPWALLQHGAASPLGSAMRQSRRRSACYQLSRGAIAFWIDAGATSTFPPVVIKDFTLRVVRASHGAFGFCCKAALRAYTADPPHLLTRVRPDPAQRAHSVWYIGPASSTPTTQRGKDASSISHMVTKVPNSSFLRKQKGWDIAKKGPERRV